MHFETGMRVKDYSETLVDVEPYLKKACISRVANITDLDKIGVPVYTAIRPLAKEVVPHAWTVWRQS